MCDQRIESRLQAEPQMRALCLYFDYLTGFTRVEFYTRTRYRQHLRRGLRLFHVEFIPKGDYEAEFSLADDCETRLPGKDGLL